jgi:hypothetical protein
MNQSKPGDNNLAPTKYVVLALIVHAIEGVEKITLAERFLCRFLGNTNPLL